MKFAHTLMTELESNEYPEEWRDAAIRYRQLKKCIKRVQKELMELGLSAEMLKMLTAEKSPDDSAAFAQSAIIKSVPAAATLERRDSSESVASSGAESTGVEDDLQGLSVENTQEKVELLQGNPTACVPNVPQGITFSYWFDGTLQSFVPKLVLTVDAQEGIPVTLNLAPETREALEKLVERQHNQREQNQDQDDGASIASSHTPPGLSRPGISRSDSVKSEGSGEDYEDAGDEAGDGQKYRKRSRKAQRIQVPLSADIEFFKILTSEISSLDVLQTKEEHKITTNVVDLGNNVTDVAKPASFSSQSDLYPWREIFRVYIEASIFFSNRESDNHRQRTLEQAETQMAWFQNEVQRLELIKQFRNKSSATLWKQFLVLNYQILRLLKFQSINQTAMRKILKKFDKRTALNAQHSFPSLLLPANADEATIPLSSSTLAKAICATMHSRLLDIIPQLDDYLCPICSSISIKPVRLSCAHVFCVRCLVKLQRERAAACPMCRAQVVLLADASNLDIGLLNFLKHYFPKEAKIKQLENEREVTLEQFRSVRKAQRSGRGQRNGDPCVVM